MHIAPSAVLLEDAESILALRRPAYQPEAELHDDPSPPPLTQGIESLRAECAASVVLKATCGAEIVGSVRAKVTSGTCASGRFIVHPTHQRRGIGSSLLQRIETASPPAEPTTPTTNTQ